MLIKKSHLAKLCGVKPPSISGLIEKGSLHVSDGRIDLDNPLNLAYLSKHNPASAAEYQRTGTIVGVGEKAESPNVDPKPSTRRAMAKDLATVRAEEKPIVSFSDDDDTEETPTFDPMAGLTITGGAKRRVAQSDDGPSLDGLTDAEVAETLRKPLYDSRKAKMESEIKAVALDTLHRSLGEREEFDNLIQCLWQAMQMNYIDILPKQAALICKRLGCVGKELEVIEVLEGDVKKRQDNIAKVIGDILAMRLSNLVKEDEAGE